MWREMSGFLVLLFCVLAAELEEKEEGRSRRLDTLEDAAAIATMASDGIFIVIGSQPVWS